MLQQSNLSGPTVLLVADGSDDRQMYSEYLRLHRCRVLEVNNTERALDVAPMADIVVTGIRIPGAFDGLELVRRLRAGDHTRATPIIVLTACAFDETRERAHTAGCDVFLAKPCLPDTLAREVRDVLAARMPRWAADMAFGRARREIA